MESKVPEAQADKEASAKNQEQQPTNQWKEIFRSTKHDLSPGYLPNIIVTSVAALITPVLGILINSPKTIIIGVALAATFVIWGAAYALIRRIPQPPKTEVTEQTRPSPIPTTAAPALHTQESVRPFSVAVEWQFGHGHRKMESWNWVTYYGEGEWTACPVSVALNIRLVNLRSVPSTIIAFRVEAKNHKNQWVKLVMMDVHSPGNELYYVVGPLGLKEAVKMDMKTTSFDYLITKTIPPHEPVRGWAYFAAPEEVRVETDDLVRIYLKDAAGVEMTDVVLLGEDMDDSVRGSDHFNYKGNTIEDISSYQLRYWYE